MKKCAICLRNVKNRTASAKYCGQCGRTKYSLRGKAISVTQRAIRRGEMPPARAYMCVDCGNPATQYDHRDYSKPLHVDPVCRSCNWHRGPADWSWLRAKAA